MNVQSLSKRLIIYLAGIIVLCLGIVFCVKCGLGVSPINSVPYVLTHLMPLTLGEFSILFYLVNIALQLILSDRKDYVGILLQLPVSFIFGFVIDLWDAHLPTAGSSIIVQILFLCCSLFFTAFGIMLIVCAHLVPDPPTGAVQALTKTSQKQMGNVKIVYDCSCVIASLLIGILGAHHLIGFGIATIASAIFVGRILAILQNTIGQKINQFVNLEPTNA